MQGQMYTDHEEMLLADWLECLTNEQEVFSNSAEFKRT